MFRPELGSPLEFADLATAPVFRVLLEVVGELGEAGFGSGSLEADAITAWSLVHGLAVLLLDGPLHGLTSNPKQVKALARRVTSNLFAAKR
ncbi:MAG: hypothetical protein C4332_15310 [Meiothermus sp.]|mgnify:CR=1 FL=1